MAFYKPILSNAQSLIIAYVDEPITKEDFGSKEKFHDHLQWVAEMSKLPAEYFIAFVRKDKGSIMVRPMGSG